MIKRKWLLWCGMLAPLVYIGTVILGGLLRPEYSQFSKPISGLTAVGVPNKALLDGLFMGYNLLVIAFGVGIIQQAISIPHSKLSGIAAGVALIGSGMCGLLLQLYFPQDAGARAAVTVRGALHFVFTGLTAFTSTIAMLSSALWFRKQPDLQRYVTYTLVTFVVVLICGGFSVAAMTSGFSLSGLVERLTISVLLVWMFVVALRLYTLATRADEYAEKMKKLHSPRGRRQLPQ